MQPHQPGTYGHQPRLSAAANDEGAAGANNLPKHAHTPPAEPGAAPCTASTQRKPCEKAASPFFISLSFSHRPPPDARPTSPCSDCPLLRLQSETARLFQACESLHLSLARESFDQDRGPTILRGFRKLPPTTFPSRTRQ